MLVWGVIREFTESKGLDIVRDNYLFVGENMQQWDEERAALVNMTPEAFIVTDKDKFNYKKGEICIRGNTAGTILLDV